MQSAENKSFNFNADAASKYYAVNVLLPVPLSKAYTYLAPIEMSLGRGSIVEVQFGPRVLLGVVWEDQVEFDVEKFESYKLIEQKIYVKPLTFHMMQFLDWMARYTMTPLGNVLKLALSGASLKQKSKSTSHYFANSNFEGKFTKKQKTIFDYLQAHENCEKKCLMEACGTTGATLKKMVESGILLKEEKQASYVQNFHKVHDKWALNHEQRIASDHIYQLSHAQKHKVILLDGVTGSGKTVVYFDVIEKLLKEEKQILILLPEIALSAQWITRFEKQFGCKPAVWHSEITLAQKRDIWRGCQTGDVKVVVGARSALFLPFNQLGLMIIDEEHEGAYKQEEGVIYHARDLAIVRAYYESIPAVLVSATPSIETYANIKDHKYDVAHLTQRYGNARFPEVAVVDLLDQKLPPNQWLTNELEQAITTNLKEKEQSLLFLNRRGYSPLMLCRTCGYRFKCDHCSAWMILHKRTNQLHCHHCETILNIPKTCPKCDEEESFALCGPGVERIAEEVHEKFPDARVLYMTSDHITSHKYLMEAIHKIEAYEVDIIIGTQMIAKGHHFPNLTLVGVIDADIGLAGVDPRGVEKTYQLLHQVSGRAGREDKAGRVLIQTTMKDHPLIQALIDENRDAFLDYELEQRELGQMPPYSKLAALILSGENEQKLNEFCSQLARVAPIAEGVDVLGPAPAPLALLRGMHRQRFLIQVPKGFKVQAYIQQWLKQIKKPSNIKCVVDIDPYTFL